jgi:high-affinity iron transporter
MARSLWLGVGSAAALSLLVGALLVRIGASLSGAAEELFEGVMLTLAVAVLTWVVVWMQGQRAAAGAEAEVGKAATTGQRGAVFLAAFVAVGREGLETGLFVSAAAFASETGPTLLGTALGLLTAGILGAGLYLATLRLDLRPFFAVTSLLLILFAAGLLGHAVHEFNELGWIPSGPQPLWDTSRFLMPGTPLGETAAVLFGYDSTPSLAQVIAYAGYLAGMLLLLVTRMRRQLPERGTAPAR